MKNLKMKMGVILMITAIVAVNAITMEKGLLFWDNASMKRAMNSLQNNDLSPSSAYNKLLKTANKAIHQGPFSVIQKESVPPSGDKHDFTSMSPYWWPNPNTKDGLPYIRKDGQRNPESIDFDKVASSKMSENVRILALAYYFFNDEKYAQKTAELIRTWFINPETKMNPNMNYAQFVPGKSEGRSFGVIQSRGLIFTIDAVSLLKNSEYWTNGDQQAYDKWMSDYYLWLRDGELGQLEFSHLNNHGTWCELQLLALAVYNEDFTFARQLIDGFYERRIKKQIKPDGTQPLELERTKALFYSIFNLRASVMFLNIAEKVEPDKVREIVTQDDRLKNALTYLIPYITNEEEWPYQQITSIDENVEELIPVVCFFKRYIDDPVIDQFDKYLATHEKSSVFHLLYNQEK